MSNAAKTTVFRSLHVLSADELFQLWSLAIVSKDCAHVARLVRIELASRSS
jgi:hypothetical protein